MMKITMEAARVNAKLTQQELADKLKVSRSTVVNVENGYVEVKPIYLYAFCHVVGVSEDDIILPKKSTNNGLLNNSDFETDGGDKD